MDQRPAPLSPTTPGFTQHLVAHHKILSHAGCRDGQVSFFKMAHRVHQLGLFSYTYILLSYSLGKQTALFWRRYHWFPRQMTSEKRMQKFHTDDTSLPRSE